MTKRWMGREWTEREFVTAWAFTGAFWGSVVGIILEVLL